MVCVSTKVVAPTKTRKLIHYRSMKKFDETVFCKEVEMIPFHIAYLFDDVNDIAWCHEHLLPDVIECHAPLKKRTLKLDSVPFMNSDLRKAIHRRNQLRNKFWKNRSQKNWEEYRKQRNRANNIRRLSEFKFFQEKSLSSTKSADFWRTFKPYLNSKLMPSNNITLKEGNDVINKPIDVCNILKHRLRSSKP